jgi:DNA-binding transcriptional MerR regulator
MKEVVLNFSLSRSLKMLSALLGNKELTDKNRARDGFTTRFVSLFLGEPPRTVQYWVDYELVLPDISPPSGRGKGMLFSTENIMQLGMIKALQQSGVSLGHITVIMHLLRASGPKDFFSNLDFGTDKELLYVCAFSTERQVPLGLFEVTIPVMSSERLREAQKRFLKDDDPFFGGTLYFTTVMLGQVKKAAIQLLVKSAGSLIPESIFAAIINSVPK